MEKNINVLSKGRKISFCKAWLISSFYYNTGLGYCFIASSVCMYMLESAHKVLNRHCWIKGLKNVLAVKALCSHKGSTEGEELPSGFLCLKLR